MHQASCSCGVFPLCWGRSVPDIGKVSVCRLRKRRTYYGLTNRRVLVVSVTTTWRLLSKDLADIDSVVLTTRKDGVGLPMDIDLGELVFHDIADAKHVQERIRSERGAVTRNRDMF